MQESIRSWLESRFLSPVVAFVASDCSEAAAQKNGMSMVQLVRPFFTYTKRSTHIRLSDKGDAVPLHNFSVRIMYPECCEDPDTQTRLMHCIDTFKDASHIELKFKGPQLDSVIASISQPPSFAVLEGQEEDDLAERKALKDNPLYNVAPDVDHMIKNMTQESFERHFFALHEKFAKDYIYMVRCSYFDTIDHPIAHIIMCTTNPYHPPDEQPNDGKSGILDLGVRVSRILKQFNICSKKAEELANRNITMDKDIMKHFILVHDASDPNSTFEDACKIRSLISNYVGPQNLVLIEINSSKGTNRDGEVSPKLWVDANINTPDHYTTDGSGVVYGRVGTEFTTANTLENIVSTNTTGWLMSRKDVDSLDVQIGNIIMNRLVPYMEKKYRQMTNSVKEKRQTGLSKVASWFRGSDNKPKQEAFVKGKDSHTPTKYLPSSLELLMRRLADYSLQLRDFEGANQMYKYLKDDLNETLYQRNFNGCLIAAAQEGISLAQYFLGKLQLPAVTRTGDCRFELSRDEYIKYNVPNYGFRASLIMYLLCRARTPTPANDKALSILHKCSSIPGIDSSRFYMAVLHDMCGLCTLFHAQQSFISKSQSAKRGLRKYARLMAICGSEYADERVQLPEIALKCFSRAQRVYRYKMINTGSWKGIYNELVIQQGKLYIHFGNLTRSVGIYTAAIGGGSSLFYTNSKATENVRNYISQLHAYLEDCKRIPEMQSITFVPHMLLPNVKIPLYSSREAHYNPDDITKQEEEMLGGDIAQREWSAMETVLKSHYSANTPYVVNKFEPYKALVLQKPKNIGSRPRSYSGCGGTTACQKDNVTHEAGAGETIQVAIQFSNPVAMELELRDVCLCYIDTTEHDNKKNPPDHLVTLYGPKVPSITVPKRPPNDVASHEGTMRLTLPFMSESTGYYKIVGVAWSVLGVRGQLLLSTKEAHRGEEESKFEYATEHPYPARHCDEYLTIHVKPPEARLSLELYPPLPENIRDGFTHRCELILKNHSDKVPATSITLFRSRCTSHWIYFEDFDYATNEDHDNAIVLANESKKQLINSKEAADNEIITPRVDSSLTEGHETKKLLVDSVDAGANLRLRVTIRASASGSGFGTVGSLTTTDDASRIPSSNFGSPFHVAFMVGYFPGDVTNDSPKTTRPQNMASKSIHLCTFLRRVQMTSSLAVTTAVTPSTATGYRGSIPRGLKGIPGVSGFANVSLVLVNRGSKFEHPIRVCRISCLHDPSWVVGLPNIIAERRREPLKGKDCITDALYANDSLSCLTFSNQGLTLQVAVGRRIVKDSDIIHRQIFESENTRLFESVLLDENFIRNSNEETTPQRKRHNSIQKQIHLCKPIENGSHSGTVEDTYRCIVPSPLWYQITHSLLTSDREFGDVPPADGDDMAFYVDKGAAGTCGTSKTYTVNDIRAMKQHQMDGYIKAHISRFGKVPAQFPPVCFIVTWCTEENSVCNFGTTFHFVDVRHHMTIFANTPVSDRTNVLNDRISSVTGVLSPVALGGSSSTTNQQSNFNPPRMGSYLKNSNSNSNVVLPEEPILNEAVKRQGIIRAFKEGRSVINCVVQSAAESVVGHTETYEESKKMMEISNTLGRLCWNPLSIAYKKAAASASKMGISHVPVPLLPVTHALVSVLGKYKSYVQLCPNDSYPEYGGANVPLKVLVTNHSPLPLKIDLSVHSNSTVRSQRIRLASPAISHIGATKHIFVVLPDETHVVDFVVVVMASGMYNLNTIRFNSIDVIKMNDGMRTGDHPARYLGTSSDEALDRTVVVVNGMDLVWPMSVVKHTLDTHGMNDKLVKTNLHPIGVPAVDIGDIEGASYLRGVRVDCQGAHLVNSRNSTIRQPIKKNSVVIAGESGFTPGLSTSQGSEKKILESPINPFMDSESGEDSVHENKRNSKFSADSEDSSDGDDKDRVKSPAQCKISNSNSPNRTKIKIIESSESDDSSSGLYKPRKLAVKEDKTPKANNKSVKNSSRLEFSSIDMPQLENIQTRVRGKCVKLEGFNGNHTSECLPSDYVLDSRGTEIDSQIDRENGNCVMEKTLPETPDSNIIDKDIFDNICNNISTEGQVPSLCDLKMLSGNGTPLDTSVGSPSHTDEDYRLEPTIPKEVPTQNLLATTSDQTHFHKEQISHASNEVSMDVSVPKQTYISESSSLSSDADHMVPGRLFRNSIPLTMLRGSVKSQSESDSDWEERKLETGSILQVPEYNLGEPSMPKDDSKTLGTRNAFLDNDDH